MKNPKISALLSLLFPGLGHFYLGKIVDGIVFFVGAIILWLAIIFRGTEFLFNLTNPQVLLFISAFVFIYLYAIFDSYKKTR